MEASHRIRKARWPCLCRCTPPPERGRNTARLHANEQARWLRRGDALDVGVAGAQRLNASCLRQLGVIAGKAAWTQAGMSQRRQLRRLISCCLEPSYGFAWGPPSHRHAKTRLPASGRVWIGWPTTRSVFWQHRAMLESGVRVPPHCVEAVHFRLRAAQAIFDCSSSPHQAPLFQYSTLIATHVHAQAAGSVHCP